MVNYMKEFILDGNLSATSVTSDTARLIVSADSEFNSAICWFLEEFSAKHSINELRVRCSGWIVVRFVIGLVSSKIPLNKAVKLLSTRVCASRASECLSIVIYIIWQNQLKILTILLNKYYNLKDIGLKSASLSYTYSGLDVLYGDSGYKISTYYFMGEKRIEK